MANIYIGLNYGQQDGYAPDKVIEGAASTASTDVEIRIAVPTGGGSNWYRSELLDAIERLKEYITDGRTAVITG